MSNVQPFADNSGAEPVRGFLHISETTVPATSGLVLTHSAGSNCQAPLVVALAQAFATAGVTVLRCDLPFRQAKSTGPPPPNGRARSGRAARSGGCPAPRDEIETR